MVQLNCIWRGRGQAQGLQPLSLPNLATGEHLSRQRSSRSLSSLFRLLSLSFPALGMCTDTFIGASNCYSSIKQNVEGLETNIPSLMTAHFLAILIISLLSYCDRLCGLVVRDFGYRCRGPGCDSQALPDFLRSRGLERGPLSLVRTIEKLLE
jgi:hypothetical protein